jgi:hypothetical protein
MKVTELRVHGVGAPPPEALLADLAPTQVAGNRIAGFYRTSDFAIPGCPGSERHVECYAWSGLTSRSKTRALWIALLPFMFGNLAGWMCSPQTKEKPWRFAVHRASAALSALALTVNAVLVAVIVTADVLAYQAVRGKLASHQWWLAPLQWPEINGHPGRQLLVAVLVPGVFLAILALLGSTSRKRYEAVYPPFEGENEPEPRPVSAASRKGGLASRDFWAGEASVRLLASLHIAAAVGFLAVTLCVTARTLESARAQWTGLWYLAVIAGAAALGLAAAYLITDATSTVGTTAPAGAEAKSGAASEPGAGTEQKSRAKAAARKPADTLRKACVRLAVILAAIAAVCAGVFSWLQPVVVPENAAALPGMAGVIKWTAAGLGVPVAVLAIHVLADAAWNLKGARSRLFAAPLVVLALGFSVLNIVMLGVLIWVAHIVGRVTTGPVDAASGSPGKSTSRTASPTAFPSSR